MLIPTHRVKLVNIFTKLISEHHGEFDSILDLGCGELQEAWRNRWGDKYEGLDNRETIGADYIGDACDLSRFESNSRNVVCGWSTLEHVLCPYMMLEEAKRVSNGTVIFTTDLTQRDKNGDPTHLYSWTPKTLTQLVKKVHLDSKIYDGHGMLIVVMCNCDSNEN